MHQKKLNVSRVVNEESLMTRWHHVSGLLVVAVTDLFPKYQYFLPLHFIWQVLNAYRRHGRTAPKASADGIVDTLGLSPGRGHTLKAVRLVTPKRLGA